jgi:hypothetical protein
MQQNTLILLLHSNLSLAPSLLSIATLSATHSILSSLAWRPSHHPGLNSLLHFDQFIDIFYTLCMFGSD